MKKLVSLILLTLLLLIPIGVGADLGDFNDYDSGGYDYGGYSSGGYDYGDSDYDYGSNRYSSGNYRIRTSDGGGSIDTLPNAVVIAIIIVVIFYKFYNAKNKAKQNGATTATTVQSNVSPGANVHLNDYTTEITLAIKKNDPNFTSGQFINRAKEVFITLQNAWSERDFAKARPFEKEELYRQHEMQIKKYIENNRINVLDRININQVFLYKYVRDKEYEYLTVYIQSRMTDYIKNATTGAIIKGNPNTEYHLKYLYTFMRRVGVLTDTAKDGASVVSCPHCGAPTGITSAGKCEYCGFIVTTGEFNWVLSDIVAIKDGFVPPEGGVTVEEQDL